MIALGLALICPGRSRATNLLANPNFDGVVSPWSLLLQGSLDYASEDRRACTMSGSAALVFLSGDTEAALISTCVPVVASAIIRGQAEIRRVMGAAPEVHVEAVLYRSGDCSNPIGAGAGVLQISDFNWSTRDTAGIGDGAPVDHSAQLIIRVLNSSGDPTTLIVDEAYLGNGQDIFADSFEEAELCRWLEGP